ncbi:MAG: DUF4982 domain-containing protein [Clostridiales bacterium]|nr:DUF4982 domain-containing protein [Clostridiales bacterium]
MLKQNLYTGWSFRKGTDNPMMSAFVGSDDQTKTIQIPHDAMLSSKRSAENTEDQGIGYYTPENVEYETIYFASKEDQGKIVYLEFEGVYGNAVIEVNGEVVMRHRYGFSGFLAKISDYLNFGQDNVIKVTVLNAIHPNGRYYTGTGIYRNVSIMKADPFHIMPDGVRITTVDADKELAAIEVAVKVKNENIGHRKGILKTIFKDASRNVCGETETIINLLSGEETTIRQMAYMERPLLWSDTDPQLYSYETVLLEEDKVIDKEEGTFGVRVLQLDPIRGLQINGKTVKLKGGCVHSDNGPIGAVSVKDAEERRIRMLKEAGYNAVRTAHNPAGRAFLDACDKYGMLVMEEFIDAWTHPKPTFDYSMWMIDCWEQDMEDMVRVAYNHPSVIMYSIGNEIEDIGTDRSARWGRKFVEKLHEIDPSRYVTNGVNVMMANLRRIPQIAAELGYGDVQTGEINNMMANIGTIMETLYTHPDSRKAIRESCDMLDVVGYNYCSWLYEMEHGELPNRIFLGSETNPGDLDVNWDIVERCPYVLGDFSWTAWDYIGEPGIGRIEEEKEGYNVYAEYPWMLAYCGDFDITGYRRPVSYWRETIWNGRGHSPYIAVRRPENIGRKMKPSQWSWTDSVASWTFPGCEGKTTIAEVYTDAEEAELFLNGRSLGKRRNHEEEKKYLICWELPYEPGMLEAISYIGGEQVGRASLRTAMDAEMLVNTDKTEICEASEELIFIEVEYRDENGTLDMSADRTLVLESSENLQILGAGTANPKTEEYYTACTHELYEGRMIAVVRGINAGDGFVSICDDMGNQKKVEVRVLENSTRVSNKNE